MAELSRAFAPILTASRPQGHELPKTTTSRPKQRYGCSVVCFVWKHHVPAENDEVCKISAVKSTLEDLEDLDH